MSEILSVPERAHDKEENQENHREAGKEEDRAQAECAIGETAAIK